MKKNLHFQNFRRASSENVAKRLSKLHFTSPEKHFKGIFQEKSLLFYNFLRASGENFSKLLSKLHSNLPEEHCWRTFLFKKTNKFIFFSGFGWIFFGRVVITAVDNFRRIFLVKTSVWKSCSFISFLRASVETFSAELSKLHSTLPEEHCKRNFSEKKTSFPKFSAGFRWKFCRTVVKTAF